VYPAEIGVPQAATVSRQIDYDARPNSVYIDVAAFTAKHLSELSASPECGLCFRCESRDTLQIYAGDACIKSLPAELANSIFERDVRCGEVVPIRNQSGAIVPDSLFRGGSISGLSGVSLFVQRPGGALMIDSAIVDSPRRAAAVNPVFGRLPKDSTIWPYSNGYRSSNEPDIPVEAFLNAGGRFSGPLAIRAGTEGVFFQRGNATRWPKGKPFVLPAAGANASEVCFCDSVADITGMTKLSTVNRTKAIPASFSSFVVAFFRNGGTGWFIRDEIAATFPRKQVTAGAATRVRRQRVREILGDDVITRHPRALDMSIEDAERSADISRRVNEGLLVSRDDVDAAFLAFAGHSDTFGISAEAYIRAAETPAENDPVTGNCFAPAALLDISANMDALVRALCDEYSQKGISMLHIWKLFQTPAFCDAVTDMLLD